MWTLRRDENAQAHDREVKAVKKWAARHGIGGKSALLATFFKGNIVTDLIDGDTESNGGVPGKISLILGEADALNRALSAPEASHIGLREEWVSVFATPVLSVWERRQPSRGVSYEPLRYGLTDAEKRLVCTFLRDVLVLPRHDKRCEDHARFMEEWKKHRAAPESFIARFTECATVDITLWTRGELRGSQIVEDTPCLQALYEATLRAREDARFKPLGEYDYAGTRVEVTLIHDLSMPLGKAEERQNEVYPEKAYLGVTGRGRGWYVPAAFNTRVFRDLRDVRESLMNEKCGGEEGDSSAQLFAAEVIDFIEAGDGTCRTLHDRRDTHGEHKEIRVPLEREQVLIHVSRALQHLVSIQEPDGNFPVILSPFSERYHGVDWVRSTFLLSSLALTFETFPELLKIETFRDLLLRGQEYIKTYIHTHRTLGLRTRYASMLHYHILVTRLSDTEEMQRSKEFILSHLDIIPYDPTLALSTILFLTETAASQKEFLIERLEEVLRDFEAKRGIENNGPSTALDLARFADLPYVLRLVGKSEGRNDFEAKGEELFTWYTSLVNENGSFPIGPGRTYTYTRGTAKILESLARMKLSLADEVFIRVHEWLTTLEYTAQNTYFVEDNLKKVFIGGFRHDAHNATTWIDSTAHYLCALAYAAKQTEKTLRTTPVRRGD